MFLSKNKCFVLIPAFGDQEVLSMALERTIEAFAHFNLTGSVMVVHNGNRNDLQSNIRFLRPPFPIRFLEQRQDQSFGEAIKTGFERLSIEARVDDVLLVMPPSERYTPGLMFRMFSQIMEGNDVVIAAPFSSRSGNLEQPKQQKSLKWLTNTYYRLRNPELGWLDYTSEFGAYRIELIRSALAFYGDRLIEKEGSDYLKEMLIKLKRFHPLTHQLSSVAGEESTPYSPGNEHPLSANIYETEWNRVA